MEQMIPESIKTYRPKGVIWSIAIDEKGDSLFMDVRDETEKSIVLHKLNSATMVSESMEVAHPWWTKLNGAKDDQLFFIEYQNQQDPNQQQMFGLSWNNREVQFMEELPETEIPIIEPVIYEHGTGYHKTVSEFLALDLPLSCEYLEWNDKIIISYYLRSGNGFDRNLLLLNEGSKEWKLVQDSQIKGFSPGAFFVFNDQLIFVKDRNEVCVYTG